MTTFDDVRRLSMALPEVEEILTWETDVTFRVRNKIFAMSGDAAGGAASIKATPMAQADLIDRDPRTFAPAPYVGRFGWVNVDLARIDEGELRALLREAWRLTAPKRLASTLDDLPAGSPGG